MGEPMQRFLFLLFAAFGLASTGAHAQGLTIDIVNGNPSALPIAVVPFASESAGLPPDTDIAQIIAGDLNRCGQFRALPRQDVVEFPARESDVKYGTWRL